MLFRSRRTLETQSAIEQKKEQCRSELEELKLKVADYRFQFQAYKIASPPSDLPADETDRRGEELKKIMESVGDKISDKFEDREAELNKLRDTSRQIQQMVSEKTALYNHDIASIREKRLRAGGLGQSLEKTRKVVEELRSFEQHERKIPTPIAIRENRPEELLKYLSEKLDDIESSFTGAIPPDVVKKVVRKLFKLVSTQLKLCTFRFLSFVGASIYL